MSLVVESTRGDVVESRHEVHGAVGDADGKLVARAGAPDRVTFMRSAAKPFQALAVLEAGAFHRAGWGDEELALACASHSSEERHVALARRMLASLGLDDSHLACGPHRPLGEGVARAMWAAGVAPTAIHSNCSGKHAAMLALARHRGWPTNGYERRDHPVQRCCLEVIAAWTRTPPDAIGLGVDGCTVPAFAVPLAAMAGAYARLATAGGAAVRVREAMLAHPELIAGEGRLCTELMRAYPGAMLAKVGAAGVYGAAFLESGLGVALKVEDGDRRAAEVALLAVLDELLADGPPPSSLLASFATRDVLDTRGHAVGVLRASGRLTR